MRKIISLIMALAMIITAVSAMTITASANATWSGEPTWGGDDETGIDYVEALYFENEPTIDGFVSEAEWGERTIEMYSEQCAMGTSTPYYNSFFYWKNTAAQSTDFPMEALVWLRWDENYYYVAAIVRDYDGHSLKHGRGDTWNGDAFQFRVDVKGPNSSNDGEYDPNIGTPWYDDAKVPDFIVGYVEIAGGFVECYESTNNKGLTAYSKPVFGEVKVAVAPSEQNASNPLGYHADAAAGYTTYEIAVPWKYIYETDLLSQTSLTDAQKAPVVLNTDEYKEPNRKDPGNPLGAVGKEFGMSFTILNAPKGANAYNCFMSWGSGVAGTGDTPIGQNAWAGSNSVTLVAESVEQSDYAKYDPSKLNASMAKKVYDNVYYDYLGGDLDCATPLNNASALKTLTYDDELDMEYWGSSTVFSGSIANVGGAHGNVLNYDKVVNTHTDDDGKEHVAGVDPIDQFYIDTTIIPESSSGAGDGESWTYPLSYTFEFDVMYTGLETVQENRASELGNLFGGSSAEYYCGYSFQDKMFIVRSFGDPTDVIAQSRSFDLEKDRWYNWKFQYDNDTCTMRLLIDDEVIFNINNRYFYYSNEKQLEEGALMCWWFINTQMKMDNVKIYNFFDYVHKDSTSVDPDGAGTIKPPSIQTGGDKVEVDKGNITQGEDGSFRIPVVSKPEYKTATELKYTFSFDEEKFEFKGIVGLEEKDYKVEQAEDGTYTLTITNIAKIKAAATGARLFEISVMPKAGATVDDLLDAENGLKIKDSFKYTSSATGDNMIFVAVIAAIMIAGCAVVVSKKRRSF